MRALWKGEQIESEVFKQNEEEEENNKMQQGDTTNKMLSI